LLSSKKRAVNLEDVTQNLPLPDSETMQGNKDPLKAVFLKEMAAGKIFRPHIISESGQKSGATLAQIAR
jgi:hypothetical protein